MPRSKESADEPIDARLERLEREMLRTDSLEMAAIRRLLHGLSNISTESDPITKVDAIVDRIEELETEIQHLRAQLRAQRTQQKGSKKERAKRLARTEILRQIEQTTNPIGEGGAVDVPTMITMGHGLGIDFTHKTVGDAFQALATEWDAFELQDGSGTKEGANKRLVATADAISDALWDVYRAETGEKATGEDTVVESSEHAIEVR
ncbi:hypothetical protein [Halalkalicoccus jeotgali]|uniref:Uncharacterized protein n=1 Tax=Halalkalicoccus jeotgali (strain DSM 18796 / CECT 7217 / JCM 14584 / KCTC 4019 / B3) TaxID=795797 RepID=D8J6R3_HALJB|nr:hypothetical protein [Halalkalicoccus jeotgali]ADJ13940.1 hypothetical protein HacjB3_02735 [Halalkalicoccus jeotgali B3]ELY34017.1 hypothetical protein C497_16587 [Halalkalicoccus jeotgali B3]